MNIREIHIIGPKCRERYLSGLKNGPLAEIGVFLAGISNLEGRYCMSRPCPPVYVVLGTLAGTARLQTEHGIRLLNQGELVLAPPRVPHRYDTLHGKRWRMVWFHLHHRPWMPQFDAVRIFKPDFTLKLAEETNDILQEISASSYLGLQARMAKEAYVAVLIQRMFHLNQSNEQTRYEKILSQFSQLVMEDLAKPWTLAQMAAISGFSAGHLNRICRQYYGHPAMRQLTRWRMEHAALILRRGELKIEAVANLCGYANAFAFSVAFKRRFGCPPSCFQKNTNYPV